MLYNFIKIFFFIVNYFFFLKMIFSKNLLTSKKKTNKSKNWLSFIKFILTGIINIIYRVEFNSVFFYCVKDNNN